MPLPTKPSEPLFDWSTGASPEAVEPSAGKKATGFAHLEKPPFEHVNWLLWLLYLWSQYFEDVTDELATITGGEYDRIVGAASHATDATLQDAIDNAVARDSILVLDDATVNTVITVDKADLRIRFKPGVTYTKGSAASALQLQADRIRIYEPRFDGAYTQCVLVDAGADNCLMRDVIFSSTATVHVTDNSSPNSFSEEGSIDEA